MPPNLSQHQAVTCAGLQLVLVGPGSGKTRVITEELLHLIDQGIPQEQIVALTFSEKAAAGMSRRIENIRPDPNLAIHTFHSFCLQIMRENVLASGIPARGDHQQHEHGQFCDLRDIEGSEHIRVGNNPADMPPACRHERGSPAAAAYSCTLHTKFYTLVM
jgi:DNA helicase II / ATP-dependent DNA helicase PcrA